VHAPDSSRGDELDSRRIYWVPAVVAPARGNYARFNSRCACLEWMMAHRAEIALGAPGVTVRPVSLSRWLLGLD
jgi:hypothetical protein